MHSKPSQSVLADGNTLKWQYDGVGQREAWLCECVCSCEWVTATLNWRVILIRTRATRDYTIDQIFRREKVSEKGAELTYFPLSSKWKHGHSQHKTVKAQNMHTCNVCAMGQICYQSQKHKLKSLTTKKGNFYL